MDFHLTREQDMLRETVRAFAEEVLKPRAAGLDRSREFPVDNYRRCAELGLCGMMVPEAYGGAGFDGVSYVIAIEEVSRACASTGVILSVNNSLFCAPILRFGNEAQRRKYLVPHARGERHEVFAPLRLVAEPQDRRAEQRVVDRQEDAGRRAGA